MQQAGSLSLAGVTVAGSVTVQGGGGVSVNGGSLGGSITAQSNGMLHLDQVALSADHGQAVNQGQIVAESGSVVTQEAGTVAQCTQLYTTLSDNWRATTNGGTGPGGKRMGDAEHSSPCDSRYQASGVGGGWYRIAGTGGDAMPLSSPGARHCGTDNPGWLSGWDSASDPPVSYTTTGRYPTVVEGVTEMMVCYETGNGPCQYHMVVGVVQCPEFLLWRLPHGPHCDAAFCTAPR